MLLNCNLVNRAPKLLQISPLYFPLFLGRKAHCRDCHLDESDLED
jgi:hypothetical protein